MVTKYIALFSLGYPVTCKVVTVNYTPTLVDNDPTQIISMNDWKYFFFFLFIIGGNKRLSATQLS